MHVRNVTLEMSLKPFSSVEEDFVRATCETAFRQWLPLTDQADMVSVLLWTADGSEILDYRGEPDAEIEWARYIGGANPREPVPGDTEKRCLHSLAHYYVENPPVITYRTLARIIRTLREVGTAMTGKPVRVGATFDPGPEFAISPFKYERHNEICFAGTMGQTSFVCCYATLNADRERYAGFPDGIPQDLPLGTFLGRQAQHFLTDLGFDYFWLSNGFGFGMETWATTGAIFDGEQFHPEKVPEMRERLLDFWRLFRAECPDFPIETRGSNLTTGIDLATDAVSVQEIYRTVPGLMPPPNSPWAALNGDFGFELIGYMSHIAELPGEEFPYRFYVHDPWWLNSPWLDRYGREPHDIYLPLAVARLDETGATRTPTAIEILTIDNSYGEMPAQCPNEVIPHLLAAQADAPDQAGPLVWLYPFAEYHAMAFADTPRLHEVFYGDWFMRAAVNHGLPLNTVASTTNFIAAAQHPAAYRGSVLISIVPDAGSPLEAALLGWVSSGGKVLLYGPLDHAGGALLDALNLRRAAPMAGELALHLRAVPDVLTDADYPARLLHETWISAGGLCAVLANADDGQTVVDATVTDGTDTRVAALYRAEAAWQGGGIAWTQGTNSHTYQPRAHLLDPQDPSQWFAGDLLMRFLLMHFGYEVAVQAKRPTQRAPITTVSRHENAFIFSGYTPDTTVELRLRFPQGAPILLGHDAELVDGRAAYRLPRAWHRECRVFVAGQQTGMVSCIEQCSVEIGIKRRLLVTGLQGATLRFYPERGTDGQVKMLNHPAWPFLHGDFLAARTVTEEDGSVYQEACDVTGDVLISW